MAEFDVFAATPEVRSYIYQQLSEIQGLLPPLSTVGVFAKDPRKKEGPSEEYDEEVDLEPDEKIFGFRLAFVVFEGGLSISGEGRSDNIYEAASSARQNLEVKLTAIRESREGSSDRNQHIEGLKSTKSVH